MLGQLSFISVKLVIVEKTCIKRAILLGYWLCRIGYQGGSQNERSFRNNIETLRNNPARFEKDCAFYVSLCVVYC